MYYRVRLTILKKIIMIRRLYISLVMLSLSMFVFGQAIEYLTKENVPYYDEPVRKQDEYIAERCVLDIYYPAQAKGFATIVWFHGGGLTGGNKSVPQALKEKGFTLARRTVAKYREHLNIPVARMRKVI